MSSPALENCLARLYCNKETLKRFLEDPEGESSRQGLTTQERGDLLQVSLADLNLAAKSFAIKRSQHSNHKSIFRGLLSRRRG